MAIDEILPRLHHVLQDLCFPARRWQILAEADMYGADTEMRTQLYALPVRLYENCADIASAMESCRALDPAELPVRHADVFHAVPRTSRLPEVAPVAPGHAPS
jgi:hypothetical protein